MVELSPVPSDWPVELNIARPFFYFSLMQHLLAAICPASTWGKRVKNLLREEFPAPDNQAFSLLDLGAFAQWEAWPLWPQQ